MRTIAINENEFQVNSVAEIVDDNSVHLNVDDGMIILVNVKEQGFATIDEYIKYLENEK
jgi:hypothetical protein